LVKEVNREGRGPQLLITRVSPDFLMKLFQREVPEIERGTLEIVGAVRDPGNRAKIAVRSHDERVDPVGTCVGIRGSRVQSVTNELNGERVDIIPWDDNPAEFVLKALAPAEVSEIHVNEDEHLMDIVVHSDKLAQAIGRNGVNVRLASDLTGWKINLTSPEDYEQRAQAEMDVKSRVFVEKLDVAPDVARILVEEGFEDLEQIAYVPREEMLSIQEFDEETTDELRKRAREEVERIEADTAEKMKRIDPALSGLEGMDDATLRALARGDILTLAALADMDTEEFAECTGDKDEERAGKLIMAAREIVFAAEEEEAEKQKTPAADIPTATDEAR
jgi:N utilization substance protein A